MQEVDRDSSIRVELNKNLFKAVTQNVIEDIRHLMNSGADANSEFTIDELVNNKLLDDCAINIIKYGKISVHSLPATKIFTDRNTTSILKKSYKEVIFLPILMNEIILSKHSKLSALQLAVLYGWKESIVELIKKGSNPNKALDIQGITILQLMCTAAVFKDKRSHLFDEDIIQLLFDYGADPNIQDVNGKTFLHYAVLSGDFLIEEMMRRFNMQTDLDTFDDIRRIENFLINGANPNIRDKYHYCNIIFNIVESKKYVHIQQNLINLLLDHGGIYGTYGSVQQKIFKVRMMHEEYATNYGDANAEDQAEKFNLEHKQRAEKNTQLINAVKSQEKSEVSILLNENISPNVRDNDGHSALHLAVQRGEYDIVDLLLNKGANPNIKSWKNGATPLFNAVISSRIEIGELLLKHKANPNVKNTKGLTPLYFSVTSNDVEMTELLLKYKANPDVSSQINPLLSVVNNVKDDSDMAVVENTFKKVKSLAKFLNSKEVIMRYTLYHQAMNIAEKNKNIANKFDELLDELATER